MRYEQSEIDFSILKSIKSNRTISLMNHITNLIFQILMNRVYRRIGQERYSIINDTGIRNVISRLRMISKIAIQMTGIYNHIFN